MYPKRGLRLEVLEIEPAVGILSKWLIEKSIQVTMWENKESRIGQGRMQSKG